MKAQRSLFSSIRPANLLKLTAFLLVCAGLSACDNDSSPNDPDLSFTFDFDNDTQDWTLGFADYPAGEETFYELDENAMLQTASRSMAMPRKQ